MKDGMLWVSVCIWALVFWCLWFAIVFRIPSKLDRIVELLENENEYESEIVSVNCPDHGYHGQLECPACTKRDGL